MYTYIIECSLFLHVEIHTNMRQFSQRNLKVRLFESISMYSIRILNYHDTQFSKLATNI